MVDISDETREDLEELADNNDEELEDVIEAFEENYENVQEKATGVSDDRLEGLALRTTRTDLLSKSRVPTEEVEIATVGGTVQNWSNGDNFVGKGIVDRNPDEDGGERVRATVIVNEDEADLVDFAEAFDDVGNIVRGDFTVDESNIDGLVQVYAQEHSDYEVIRPDDRTDVIEAIHENVPEFSLDSIADNPTATEVVKEDGERYNRAVAFGADIRRIEADVFDSYKDPDEGNGSYTLRDDTMFDEGEFEDAPEIFDAENANENATPGLTVWADPQQVTLGSGSIAEFYGTVTQNDEGRFTMDLDAVRPIVAEDFDGYDASQNSDDVSGGEQTETNVDTEKV